MNRTMLETELYKIFSKKVIWISLLLFLMLSVALKIQWVDAISTNYTLEPVRAQLTQAVNNKEFQVYVRKTNYRCTIEEMSPFLPNSVFEYIDQYHNEEEVHRFLYRDLESIINNYYERMDRRSNLIAELEDTLSGTTEHSTLLQAKKLLLEQYQRNPISIELNLERSANNFIDINHAALFPGLIMLLILVGLAGIYSDESVYGTQAVILTTQKGRQGVFFSKLCAMTIYVIFVVIVMETTFFVSTALCYHGTNTTISAASTFGLSLTPFDGSVYDFCMRQVFGTLLAGLVFGSIIVCISVYSKHALIPFFVVGLFYGGTAIYANSVPFPDYLSTLHSLPGELSLFMLQTQVELVQTGHYTNLFGLILPTLAVNVLFNLILMGLSLILCYLGYVRKQVKE